MSELRSNLVAVALLLMIGALGFMLVTRERPVPTPPDATSAEATATDAPTTAPPRADTAPRTEPRPDPTATAHPPLATDSPSHDDSPSPSDSPSTIDSPSADPPPDDSPSAIDSPPMPGNPLADTATEAAPLVGLTTLARVEELDDLILTTDRVVWRTGRSVYQVARDGSSEAEKLLDAPFDIYGIASPVPDLLFVAAENTIYRYGLDASAPPKPLIAPSKPFVVSPHTLFADEENVWFVGTQSPGDTDDEILAIWRVSANGGRMKTRAVGDKYLRAPVDIVFDGESFYLGRYYANNVRRVPAVDGSPKTLARDVIVGIEFIAVGGGMVFVVDEDELWRVSTPKGGDPVRMLDQRIGPVASDGRSVYWMRDTVLMALPVDATEAESPRALHTLRDEPLLLRADGQGLVVLLGDELVAIAPP